MKNFYLFIFCLIAPFFTLAQNGYYVSDGRGNIVHHPNGDPNLVKADEWQIHLYRCSGNPGRWGSISGKSAQEVLKELKRSQQFDLKYAKWGYGDESRAYTEPLCSFKPVGPIAVIRDKSLKAPFQDELAELLKFYDEYREYEEVLNNTFAILEDNSVQSGANPMSNIGSKFHGYVGNLREARRQLGRLQEIFNNLETASSQKIDALFDNLQNSFDELNKKSNDLKNSLSNVSASGRGNNSWQFSKSWPYDEGGSKTWTTNLQIRGKSIIEVFNRKLVGSRRDDFNTTDEKVIEFTDYIPDLINNSGFDSETLQRLQILYKQDNLQEAYGRYSVQFKPGAVKVKVRSYDGKTSEYDQDGVYFTKQADRDDFYNKIISVLSNNTKGQSKGRQDDWSSTQQSAKPSNSKTNVKRTDDGWSESQQSTKSSNTRANEKQTFNDWSGLPQSSKQPLSEQYLNEGKKAAHNKDYDTAIANFNSAIDLFPASSKSYLERGIAYLQKGEHEKALKDFLKAEKLGENDFYLYANRGAAYHYQKNYKYAIEDYTKALYDKSIADKTPVYALRGQAYEDDSQLNSALADYEQALKLTPTYKTALDGKKRIKTILDLGNKKFIITNKSKQKLTFTLSENQQDWDTYSLESGYHSTYWFNDKTTGFFQIKTDNGKNVIYAVSGGNKYEISWNNNTGNWDLFKD